MALETTRRSLITGLIALVAAPAIVRVANLMPVKQMRPVFDANEITFTAYGDGVQSVFWMAHDGRFHYWDGGVITVMPGDDVVIDLPSVPIRRDAVLA